MQREAEPPVTQRKLRVLLAPQEFKGSLTAKDAANAMAAGARRPPLRLDLDILPLSDGGPGLVEALVSAERGEIRLAGVSDPLGRSIEARFGLIHGGATAVIELAAASGISLLQQGELDPLRASSFGTGQVIRAALDSGARDLIIGLGGSATNDGGAGMAEALGVRLLAAAGTPITRGGAGLAELAHIDASGMDPRIATARVTAASDVHNPLCGPEGASAVYGPQKGATVAMVEYLDAALHRYATVIQQDLRKDVCDLPGAGAAGGAGAALVAFLGAEMRPGFALVADVVHLRERVRRADIVLTGEGSLDRQTGFGKAVSGLAAIAESEQTPLIALAGILADGYQPLLDRGVTAAFSIVPGPMSLEDARHTAQSLVADRTESVLRLAQRLLAAPP
jgi:glycerate kinase